MVGLNPVFCHRYSIQACAARKTIPLGMRTGCEALETKVSRVLWDGNGNREGTSRLLAPGGSGPELCGMVSIHEPPINVVIENKPKVLKGFPEETRIGLGQKARGQV